MHKLVKTLLRKSCRLCFKTITGIILFKKNHPTPKKVKKIITNSFFTILTLPMASNPRSNNRNIPNKINDIPKPVRPTPISKIIAIKTVNSNWIQVLSDWIQLHAYFVHPLFETCLPNLSSDQI